MPDQPERSLADQPPESPTTGDSPFGTPNPAPTAAEVSGTPIPVVSIVDNVLNLDELLSADVRRAEKTARFCTKPWLEADIDELLFELDGLTDEQGNALPENADRALEVAVQIQTLQAEYGAAFVSVRMSQLASDDWKAFRATWREVLAKAGPKSDDFYDALIEVSSLRPKITAAQAKQLREKLGDPQMDALSSAAWDVNTNSGVSIPKSPLSSHVLRQAARLQS